MGVHTDETLVLPARILPVSILPVNILPVNILPGPILPGPIFLCGHGEIMASFPA